MNARVFVLRRRTIDVPVALDDRVQAAHRAFAARFGESLEQSRRLFEIALLQRGLAALEKEPAT